MRTFIAALIVLVLVFGGVAQGVTIDTVPVGNAGNAGELSGAGAGSYGPDRVCGAVDYTYNIGKYEVTAGQYRDFLNAVAKTDTYGLYNSFMESNGFGCQITQNGSDGNYTYDFGGAPSGTASDWEDRPVNYVSWGDAARFANWLHNGQPTGVQDSTTTEDGAYYLNGATTDAALMAITRETDATWVIPTEDEWYKAAYHDETAALAATYFDYPTSNDSTPSNTLPDGGNNANFVNLIYYTIGSPYWRTEVGEFELSQSPYGTFDQCGNLWEWNEAILSDSARGCRGGSFHTDGDESDDLHASYRGDYTYPASEYFDIGFRVASSVVIPEPSTILLLLLGAAGIFACGRRRRR